MIRAVIFDFNGVISEDMNQTMPALAGALGISMDPKVMRTVWYPLYVEASLGRIAPEEFWIQLRQRLAPGSQPTGREEAQWLSGIGLREPDLLPTLAELKRRHTLGLLSNHVGRWARALLDRWGLTPCFSAVLISSDMGLRKPDLATYQRICQLIGVAPHQALYLADEEEDLRAAQRVGMRPFFIPGEDAESSVGVRLESVARLADIV